MVRLEDYKPTRADKRDRIPDQAPATAPDQIILVERPEDRNTAIVPGNGNSSKQRFLPLAYSVASLA